MELARFEHTIEIARPIGDVWSDLVSGRLLLGDAAIEARTGGRVAEDRRRGVVREVEALRRLSWEWSDAEDPAGWSLVEIDLEAIDTGGTRVTVTESLHAWEQEVHTAWRLPLAATP